MRLGGTVSDFLPFVTMFRDIHHVRRLLSKSLSAFPFSDSIISSSRHMARWLMQFRNDSCKIISSHGLCIVDHVGCKLATRRGKLDVARL